VLIVLDEGAVGLRFAVRFVACAVILFVLGSGDDTSVAVKATPNI